jgi:hypothetical protein
MSDGIPISRAALVDTIGLRVQELHAAGQLGEQPLLRIDNREQAKEAPFQFDAARGQLHRAGCAAIPPGSRSALYGVWSIGAEDPALACPRCNPMGRPAPTPEPQSRPAEPQAQTRPAARPSDDQAVDLLYGLLSIVSQFGGVLRERGQEYRHSRVGAVLGARIEKIYAGVNERERRVLDVLTTSLDTLAAAMRDIEGGLHAERDGDGAGPEPSAGPTQDQAR